MILITTELASSAKLNTNEYNSLSIMCGSVRPLKIKYILMKKGIILSLLVLLLLQVEAQQPDAGQIMSKHRDLTLAGSMSSTISLIITEKNGSIRSRTFSMITKSYSDGAEKRLIKFLEPADVKGTGLLIIDNKNNQDEMWIYLPALKKTRRIVTSEKGKNFMSSEFSNSDMTAPALLDFSYKHSSTSGENKQWVVESMPVSTEKAEEYGYSKRITYMNSETYQVTKVEFYNFNNQLYKIIEIKSVQPLVEGRYLIKDMKVNNFTSGRSSEFILDKIATNKKIEDSVFSLQNLER